MSKSGLWMEYDNHLNQKGKVLLSSTIACVCLPPILGLPALYGSIWTIMSEKSKRHTILSQRNTLRKKYRAGEISRREKIKLHRIDDRLQASKSERYVTPFLIGYSAMMIGLLYLSIKLMCTS